MGHVVVRPLAAVLCWCLVAPPAFAEDTKSPANEFVSTQVGELPIILSAPHGGALAIPGVAIRKGEGIEKGPRGFFLGRDSGTEEFAHDIAAAVEGRMGKKPWFVIARVDRKYLDPNRPAAIAYESPAARPVYDAYHAALAAACRGVKSAHGRGLLLDVHGQGSLADTVIRGTGNGQTVKRLIEQFGDKAHNGPESFFGLLAANGFKINPADWGREYSGLSGGYIVKTYGSHTEFGIDAMQLEFGMDYRKKEKRKEWAEGLAKAIEAYSKLYLANNSQDKR